MTLLTSATALNVPKPNHTRKSGSVVVRADSQVLLTVPSTTTSSPKSEVQSMPKIRGPTAVITGGSQGVGRELALMLSGKGYNVVVAARQAERLEQVAQECNNRRGKQDSCRAVSTDITDESQVQQLAEQVAELYEDVDLLVNNAGVCLTGPMTHSSMQDYRGQMVINYFGAVAMTQAFTPLLKQTAQKGKNRTDGAKHKPTVAFVNSFCARVAAKNMSAYSASKFALAGFVDAIRPELYADGIHVTQIQPGVIKSDFLERAQFRGPSAKEDSERMQSMLSGSLPILQTTDQVAQAVICAVEYGKKEVMVGATFKLAMASNNILGINPFAM